MKGKKKKKNSFQKKTYDWPTGPWEKKKKKKFNIANY